MNKSLIYFSFTFAICLFILTGYLVYSNNKLNNSLKPPNAPANLYMEASTATEIKLVWVDSSNNENGFQVIRDGQAIGDLPEGIEKFTDVSLRPATCYQYNVIAYNQVSMNSSTSYFARTKNPPIRVWIDKIGVADNGEDFYREVFDEHGEIFTGLIISDGKSINQKRLPINDYYKLADNSVIDVDTLAFSTSEVGEYITISIIGFENDGGLGDEILCQALNSALKASFGGGILSTLMLTASEVDFTDTFKNIIGFDDDFLGEYLREYKPSDNWGIGTYSDIKCKNDDGNIGLRLWIRIDCPEYDYSSE